MVSQGLTPILDVDQMKQLLESIDTQSIVGLRNRALIGVMTAKRFTQSGSRGSMA